MAGWEDLCKAAEWYQTKGVFLREARAAWKQVRGKK